MIFCPNCKNANASQLDVHYIGCSSSSILSNAEGLSDVYIICLICNESSYLDREKENLMLTPPARKHERSLKIDNSTASQENITKFCSSFSEMTFSESMEVMKERRRLLSELIISVCPHCGCFDKRKLKPVEGLKDLFSCYSCQNLYGFDDTMNYFDLVEFVETNNYQLDGCITCGNSDPSKFRLQRQVYGTGVEIVCSQCCSDQLVNDMNENSNTNIENNTDNCSCDQENSESIKYPFNEFGAIYKVECEKCGKSMKTDNVHNSSDKSFAKSLWKRGSGLVDPKKIRMGAKVCDRLVKATVGTDAANIRTVGVASVGQFATSVPLFLVGAIITNEMYAVFKDVKNAQSERQEGNITREEFIKITIKRVSEGCGVVGGTAFTIAIPVLTNWIGCSLAAVIGQGVGALVGRRVCEVYDKTCSVSDKKKNLME